MTVSKVRIIGIDVNVDHKTAVYVLEVDGQRIEFLGQIHYDGATVRGVSIPDEMECILHKVDAKSPVIVRPTFNIIEGLQVRFPIDL
ncbi:hypothetical protein [Rhizobium sp. BK491]|uniref:hypothetical protein n=1 Tax=Rhizobium sp. BK491 TaxID=2587009 RepID=UPI00161AE3FE|nr:hypothetical protein [Rhizobium sp. BK491]MBB3571832.1 hypothetical protein [Rhizobium sp. BK491]